MKRGGFFAILASIATELPLAIGAHAVAAPWDEPELKARIKSGEFASKTVKRWREEMNVFWLDLGDLESSRRVFKPPIIPLLFALRRSGFPR